MLRGGSPGHLPPGRGGQPRAAEVRAASGYGGENLHLRKQDSADWVCLKTAEGDEAVISYNEASGNVFGSMKTHDGKSYALEKCHLGHVWKEFDVASFGPDESIQRQTIPSLHQTVSHETPAPAPREDDNSTMVTYSVMFYFTPQFAAVTADIPGFIDQVIAETNQGYRNSRIPVQVSKLCIEAATIDDVAEPTTFLHTFEAMKTSAAALTNTADAAALLAYDFDACGIAFFYTYTSGRLFRPRF